MHGQRFARSQRMTIVNGCLTVVVVVVILQLWLLTGSVNAFMGGDVGVAIPAALVSLACLVFNAGLVGYLRRLR